MSDFQVPIRVAFSVSQSPLRRGTNSRVWSLQIPAVTSEDLKWDRSPIRRKHCRRGKRVSSHVKLAPTLRVLGVSIFIIGYLLCSNPKNPVAIMGDSLMVGGFLDLAIHYTYRPCSAKSFNKLMHCLNGNIPEITPPKADVGFMDQSLSRPILKLSDLIPPKSNSTLNLPDPNVSRQSTVILLQDHLHDFQSATQSTSQPFDPQPRPQIPHAMPWEHNIKLSRHFLLQCRPPKTSQDIIQTRKNPQYHRSGRRRSYRDPKTACRGHFTYKPRRRKVRVAKPQTTPPWSNILRNIENSGIHKPSVETPTPPQRGTPGVVVTTNEECHPTRPEVLRPPQGHGSRARCQRRRQYRQWRKLAGGYITAKLPGSSQPNRGKPLKAALQNQRKSKHKFAMRNATYFRKHVLQQQTPHPTYSKHLTVPLSYSQQIKIAAQNVQSLAVLLKHQAVLEVMSERSVDVLFLTETHNKSSYNFNSEAHLFIHNGSKKDPYGGVSAVISPRFRPHIKDVVQHDSRILEIILGSTSGDIHLVGVYAPRDKHQDDVKDQFWNQLEQILQTTPQPEPIYVLGDFNVRLQGRSHKEQEVLGPHIFGRGYSFANTREHSNRSRYVALLHAASFKDALTFKQPNLLKQITYKDKFPPPTSWSQFVLDPLILLQLWDKIQSLHHPESQALEVASCIRSFLDIQSLQPPVDNRIVNDPRRFQSLDRLILPGKWLPTVKRVKAVHSAAFPSDHYLLEMEVRVKLGAKPKQYQPPLRYDYSAINHTTRKQFNQKLQAELGTYQSTPQETPPSSEAVAVYTDGSGSGGRCTATSSAGWGFVVLVNQVHDHSAHGPVETDSRSVYYLGATVASNNSAEITAIIESLLYVLSLPTIPQSVEFFYDSKWAANATIGTSRPKRHKLLVNQARKLFTILSQRTLVKWTWVKGHSGDTYNEMADSLAEEGKRAGEYQGGRSSRMPFITPDSFSEPDDTFQVEDNDAYYRSFVRALHIAEATTLPPKEYVARKPWINTDLARQMKQAKEMKKREDPEYPAYYRTIQKQAKKAKRQWLRDKVMEDTNLGQPTIWRHIRHFRTGFREKKRRLEILGKPVPWSKTSEAFANHLTNVQWGPSELSEEELAFLRNSESIFPADSAVPPSFSREELQDALRQLKKDKAPGSDGIRQDLFRVLNYTNETSLLRLFNSIFRSKQIPKDWKKALVVSIYKNKGLDTDPANYRPISLLNTLYKLYAAMLQKRLAADLDHKLRETQYGFRARKGTKDPIFILRRYQDYSAKTGRRAHLLFLDWKMAFDKLDHSALLISLARLGLSQHYISIIKDIYADPVFQTVGHQDSKAWYPAHTGIRQGCPLSPYLFILTMTCLFHDVDKRLRGMGVPCNNWSIGKPIYDLEYADDTVLMGITSAQLQEFLSVIQVEAMLYGMQLNKDKTQLLVHPDHPAITLQFTDGTPVKTTQSIGYLGTEVSWVDTTKTAISARKAKAHAAYAKLQHVWRSNLCVKAKVMIFISCILSTLLYALDSLTLENKHLKTLDGWFFRYLRRAVGIKHSFYSRISNERVWKFTGRPQLPSQKLLHNQLQTLVEITTLPSTDPKHHVVFSPGLKDRVRFTKSAHRGHPRPYWYEIVSRQAIIVLNSYLDHSANRPESRRDFLGFKQILQDRDFRRYLHAAPTRHIEIFQYFRRSIGSAWLS